MFEREGTYTSGERRVQRFYPVIYPPAGLKTDYAITALAAAKAGTQIENRATSLVFLRLAAETPAYAGLTYAKLAETGEQWPIMGRSDLYFGGTGYENKQGLGVQLKPAAMEPGGSAGAAETGAATTVAQVQAGAGEILLVPVTRLYDQGQLIRAAKLLDQRRAQAQLSLHPDTAAGLGLAAGESAEFDCGGRTVLLPVVCDETIPAGVGLVPRSTGIPLSAPAVVRPVKAAVQAV